MREWVNQKVYEDVEIFVTKVIFPAFDDLRENAFFSPFIKEDTLFTFDQEYVGFAGFSVWLDSMKGLLKAEGLSHDVKNLSVWDLGQGKLEASFDVKTKGYLQTGESFSMIAHETWVIQKKYESFEFLTYTAEVA